METKAGGEIIWQQFLSQILSKQIHSSVLQTAPWEIPAIEDERIEFVIKI